MPKPVAPVVRAPTSINIESALWKAFKAACAGKGETVTHQMETLIRNWLNLHKVKTTKGRA